MVAILDCDLLSTFAKINQIRLLEKLFSELLMPHAVYVELRNAKSLGFNFPNRVSESRIKLTALRSQELEDFKAFMKTPQIHSGESEGMAIAKNRRDTFLTNDGKVVRLCEEKKILVLDLKDVLRKIAQEKLVNRKGMLYLLEEIEREDNTTIKEKEDVLEEYER